MSRSPPGTSPEGKRYSLKLIVGNIQDGEERQLKQIRRNRLQPVILQESNETLQKK